MAAAARPAVTFAQRWIVPEAYPIFAVIGAATGLAGFFIGRTLVSSPDVRITKESRAMGVLEDKSFFREGAEFYNHPVRRTFSKMEPLVMPRINRAMGSAV